MFLILCQPHVCSCYFAPSPPVLIFIDQVEPDLAEEDLVNETFVNDESALSDADPLHDMEDLGQVLLEAREEYVAQDGDVRSREMVTPRQRKALTVWKYCCLAATSLLPSSIILTYVTHF